MAVWICHPHPDVRRWIVLQARQEYPGLLQSFDAACGYASEDKNWANRSGQYAFVDYLPHKHPMTFPMIVKVRIEVAFATVVAVALEREGLVFKVE